MVSVGHFQVQKLLTFKTSLSTKPSFWKWVLSGAWFYLHENKQYYSSFKIFLRFWFLRPRRITPSSISIILQMILHRNLSSVHLTFFPIVIYYSARAVSLVKFVPCKSVKRNIIIVIIIIIIIIIIIVIIIIINLLGLNGKNTWLRPWPLFTGQRLR